MKMMHECRAMHVWIIWDVAFDGGILFLTRGKIKLVQINSNFLIANFSLNSSILSNFVEEFQNFNLVLRKAFTNVKSCISKKALLSPLAVFYHCIAKNRDIALKVCMRAVGM